MNGFDVFTYGSLMFPKIWNRVVGRDYPKMQATIPGYQRRKIRGKPYPALIPGRRNDRVEGILYLGVSPEHLARLDRFEGETYERTEVKCWTAEGMVLSALVYVFRQEYMGLVEEEPWDPEWFLREGIGIFTDDYPGFNR